MCIYKVKGGKVLKKYVVLQEEISDCGVACLLSIIRYYNGDANLETLRIETNTTNKGVTAYNLVECAKKNGFNATGMKDTSLDGYKLPCIVHIQINKSLSHFVVLYEINNNIYKIMDPAYGIKKISSDEFYKLFTNYFIILEPKNKLPKKENKDVIKDKLFIEIKNNKKNILKIIFYNILFIILSIISSFYIKIYNYREYIIILSIIFQLLNILIFLLSSHVYKKQERLKQKMCFNLTNYFFEHILKLPLKYLHLKDPGEIVKRLDEINLINDVVIGAIISSFLDTLIIISVIPIVIIIEYRIIILTTFIFIILSLTSFIILKKIKKKSKFALDSATEYNSLLIDFIYGLTSIKHSKSGDYIKSKLLSKLEEKNDKNIKYYFSLKNFETMKSILLSVLRLTINLYLVNRIYLGDFTFETLIIVDLLFEILINSLSNLISILSEILFIKNLFSKANDFYNIPILIDKSKTNFKLGTIKIKNLSYNYYNNHPLIKDITTEIKLGEKVIIKGESGSGKSTLCKILNREIDDYKGEIYINDVNIKKINILSYQKNIIYSSQSEKIFSGTIKENILLGKDISEEKLNKVLTICDIGRIISKKTFGLDTFLFSGGEELSGGERQLIILARTLVNDFEVLILDETLSEVNDVIEDKILSNIFETYKDKTIIYVSHKNKKNYFKRVISV